MKHGDLYIFCEQVDCKKFMGKVVCIKFDQTKKDPEFRNAIELDVHASYPYIIENEGEVYCVPETSQLGEIGLYKCLKFPDKWQKSRTLVANFAGKDATLFQHDGLWWIMSSGPGNYSVRRLYAWYAHNMNGPWKQHELTPVKEDLRSSRPAGTPFLYRGELYRPAQDNSETYGGRVVLNRVNRLNPQEFQEEEVTVVEPYLDSPFCSGLHTLSSVGNITLLDGKRYTFVPSALGPVAMRAIKSYADTKRQSPQLLVRG
jgi:hypothetical protein